jgi:hypothetical protein
MDIPNTNEITDFVHCLQCIEEFQAGAGGDEAPRDYARLEIGWTEIGLQIWCKRHESNVAHIDFEGAQHPANQTRPRLKSV